MEKVQEIIRKHEDVISAVIQLIICVAAVFLALKNDKNAGRKQKEKLAKTEAKLRLKKMKAEAKFQQKTLKLTAKNDLKLQKEKFRKKQYKDKQIK